MSDDIFIKHDKNGGTFQQPFLARVPAAGQQPNIAQRVYQVSTQGTQPFTYDNRISVNVRQPSDAQNPIIAQGVAQTTYQHRSPAIYTSRAPSIYNIQTPSTYQHLSPFTYDHRSPFTYQLNYQHREPSTYNHRSPLIYRTPTQTRTPSIYQARQPISYQHRSPFTYDHRSPLTYDHRSPSRTPSIYQARQPLTYDHRSPYRSPFTYDHRSPLTYDHRSPSTYDNREPSIYQHRSPDSYQHQSPIIYQHRSPSQSPFTYDHRSPFIYQHRSPSQSPFTYDHRSPFTYDHRSPFQSPFTYDHRSPFTYDHRSPSTTPANSSTPVIADGSNQVEIPFSWGNQTIQSSTTGADWTINTYDYENASLQKACVSTEITVNSSAGTGGSISVRLRYGSQSGGYQSNSVTITHFGGLDSLQARFTYTNTSLTDASSDEFAAFLYSQTANIDVGDFDQQGLVTGHPVNTTQEGNSGTGITGTGISTGSSAWVEMGRNGFSNTGICSAAMVAAAHGSDSAVEYAHITATGSTQLMSLQLRANGSNSLIKTVWAQNAQVAALSYEEETTS